MKTPTLHDIGLHAPTASTLAAWLLADAPEAADGGLSGTLVVLPSVRACGSLRHALLNAAGSAALLLPGLLTPKQLAAQLAGRLGLGGALATAPPDALRPLLLAGRLRRLPWVRERSEGAAGVAGELVRTFDEVRRAQTDWLLDAVTAGDAGDLPAGHAELFRLDRDRLRGAFAEYRQVVAADAVDVLAAVAARLGDDGAGWPGPPYSRVVVAGFAELEAAPARVLRAALASADGHVFFASPADAFSRALLATWRDGDAPSRPSAPARLLRQRLAPGAAPPPPPADADVPAPELRECGDPEAESRAAAALVCAELQRAGSCARIGVATADRALARRIVAQLRDAGVDVDDTGGLPLASLPAGRLVHDLLQCALTDLRHEPLLEVLTHPWTDLGGSRAVHARRALLLEKLVLRGESPPAGLDGYRARAVRQDEAFAATHGGAPADLVTFVDAVGAALAPLLAAPAGAAPWARRLVALRETWRRVTGEAPLGSSPAVRDDGGRDARDPGLVVLGELLDDLDGIASLLPPVTAADFAAELDRLLAATPVRPHRSPLLPVQVMGLIEARLERFDLLVIAGANEDVLPGRMRRPLFLSDAARQRAGLAGWRDHIGLQGELFLRLLHGGDRVVVTWSAERSGQPALPSPLVARLQLAGCIVEPKAPPAPLYRRRAPDLSALGAAQDAFDAEPATAGNEGPRVETDGTHPLHRTSHSGLAQYRQCPYRFLLERGYGLAEQEEVLDEFRKLDHGRAVHLALATFLAPGGAGLPRLRAGDREGALAELRRASATAFAPAPGTPAQRALWEASFLAGGGAIVDFEIDRARQWRPVAVECPFQLTLGRLAGWLADEQGYLLEMSAALATHHDLALTGRIDRVDLAPDGRQVAVIDYKTGRTPATRSVERGDEPQLTLYAVAVECGTAEGLPPDLTAAEAGYYIFTRKFTGLKPVVSLAGDRAPLIAGAKRILEEALAAADRGHPYPLVPGFRAGTETGAPPCIHCPYRGACRVDERSLPSALRAKLTQSGGRR